MTDYLGDDWQYKSNFDKGFDQRAFLQDEAVARGQRLAEAEVAGVDTSQPAETSYEGGVPTVPADDGGEDEKDLVRPHGNAATQAGLRDYAQAAFGVEFAPDLTKAEISDALDQLEAESEEE